MRTEAFAFGAAMDKRQYEPKTRLRRGVICMESVSVE